MIVVCPSCQARFQYDEARFQGVPSKRFRCPKCDHVFEVQNPLANVPAPQVPEPVAKPSPAPATVVFDASAFAQKVSGSSGPRTFLPPEMPATPSKEPEATAGQETTSRRDRDAFLAAVGGGTANLPSDMRFSLAYLTGPKASTVKIIDSPQTMIGRDEGDVITRDPETSRRHAMLEIHSDGTVWLTDLGSTNGTFVDGVQIFGTIQIGNRQEFTCGKSTFMLLARKEDSLTMD